MTDVTQEAVQPIVLERPNHAQQIAGRCVHFTGIMQPTCAAGIRYDDVKLDHAAIAYRNAGSQHVNTRSASLPCVRRYNLGGATCEKAQFPTAEQVEKEEAESKASIERMITARQAIIDHIKGGALHSGAITCPTCGASLAYSRASNGHIWARCYTEGCAAWME